MVLAPWNAPEPLARAWCLFELYATVVEGKPFSVCFGPAERQKFEAALEEHPAVQSCAVIGLPDDDLGARIHAIVNVQGEVTPEDLKAHLADRLVTYKRPKSFEFVAEPVRDDAGKVRRTALRDARIKAG
jgi:acyl-coenzyme A synthetase/AMP-(fatty) acid ligase